MKVTALKRVGKHRAGDTFDVSVKQARVLILLRVVIPGPEDETEPPRLKRTYRRRDLQAESPESS